jgi:DNA-binding response OmpR family regulator
MKMEVVTVRILLAEDEKDLNDIITQKLTSDGYSVDSCFNGQDAINILSYTEYDVIILDIMMPKADGYTVLQALRSTGNTTPVLFLTAKDAVADRVKGLDSGANDYLVKPFSFEELTARIRALTRTSFGMTNNILIVSDLTLDCTTHIVKRAEKEIILSAKEYALLEYLMHNRGIILSREKIEDHIWNFDYEGGTNVVDVYISYLRKKIDEGYKEKLIHTIRGRGYVLKGDSNQ